MSYNLSAISSNTTGILTLMQGVNNVLMFGWLGTMLLVIIFAITLMTFLSSTNNPGKSISTALFITSFLSILLRLVDLVPNKVMFVLIICFAISLAFTWKD